MNQKSQENVEPILNILSEMMPQIKEEFFVSYLGLFGSYARNEQTLNSDVDLLVDFNKPVGFEFFNLKSYLEEKLQKNVDLVTRNALKERLRETILNEVKKIEE
ncbi:nucleotidyltransferase [Candidatus Marinamargulisbacteria bacterium SCGC AAA071-K20]|nr:nucleotidyltransferase [Candidatus Marinamargulisbacteria bacterium SCGC AAA071-K20]